MAEAAFPWIGGSPPRGEVLSLTVSFDHAVVDGGPVARFGARLVELIEGCHGLGA